MGWLLAFTVFAVVLAGWAWYRARHVEGRSRHRPWPSRGER